VGTDVIVSHKAGKKEKAGSRGPQGPLKKLLNGELES